MINITDLTERLSRYCEISSVSMHEGEISLLLKAELAALGFELIPDGSECLGSEGTNVFAFLPASRGMEHLPPVLLSAHMDTVMPGEGIRTRFEHGRLYSAGDTVLGSDDKAGIAAAMEALEHIVKNGIPHRAVEVAFTILEETGLVGARHLVSTGLIRSRECISYDHGGFPGSMVLRAPGQTTMKISVKGRSAHAGAAPETGINALTVASKAISRMKLGRIDEETTANIGTIEGGVASNVVMENLLMHAEARSRDPKKLEDQVAHMRTLFEEEAHNAGAECVFIEKKEYHPYSFSENNAFASKLSSVIRSLGKEPAYLSSGGASDANVYNAAGITAINIAAGLQEEHTCHEYCDMETVEFAAWVTVGYLAAEGLSD